MTRWGSEVILERARLALDDPLGEVDAVVTMTRAQALALVARMSKPRVEGRQVGRPLTDRGLRSLLDALGVRPDAVRGMTRCPSHEDNSPSLSWRLEGDKLLIHCFAGCTFDEIRAAVGAA